MEMLSHKKMAESEKWVRSAIVYVIALNIAYTGILQSINWNMPKFKSNECCYPVI